MKMLRLLAALTAMVLIFNSVPVLADGEGNEFVENSDEIVEVADEEAELSAGYAGTGSVEINDTNFPDPIFRNYITENFDRVRDDILSPSEILAITSIDVGSKGVSNLAGIQYFTSLEELNCWNNYLSSIDLSNNTALKKLDCSHNDLTTIDVSFNTALKYLDCSFNDLTSLDVSHNTALTVLYCHTNNLTTLNVSVNSALMFFYCHNNSLTNLDLSNNTALKKLECFGNDFTILDISNNPVLINVYHNGTHSTAYGSEIYEITDGPFSSQGLLRFDVGGIIIIDTPAPMGSINMYRLYNPNSGEHFYTSNANERNMLIVAVGIMKVLAGLHRLFPIHLYTDCITSTEANITIRLV